MNGVDLPPAALPAAGEIESPATISEAGALAAAIREFIHDAYLPAEPIEALELDLDLIESGILDSLAVVEVADFLEEQSGQAVETHELTRGNIGTIAAMAAFVLRRRSAAGR